MKAKAMDDTGQVIVLAAQRARPSRERPRMSTATEERLDDIERRSSACYAEMELATHRFKKLANELDDDDESVPLLIEDEEPSLVTHLDDLKTKVTAE